MSKSKLHFDLLGVENINTHTHTRIQHQLISSYRLACVHINMTLANGFGHG